MKTLLALILVINLSSCIEGNKQSNKKEQNSRSNLLKQGSEIKLDAILSYGDGQRESQEITLPGSAIGIKEDLYLFDFYVENNGASLNSFSDKYNVGYELKDETDLFQKSWKDFSQLSTFNVHSRLTFQFNQTYDGYPSLSDKVLYIEMLDDHDKYKLQLVLNMTCPYGEELISPHLKKCINDTYKLNIKIFKIIRSKK